MQMTPRFASALVYACEIHAGQLRKGTDIPYISHLLGVTSIALDHGATEDEAIGALLHDAAEAYLVGETDFHSVVFDPLGALGLGSGGVQAVPGTCYLIDGLPAAYRVLCGWRGAVRA